VIKKNDDMNDDESMRTELEILKMVHHRHRFLCPATNTSDPHGYKVAV
jgi:hypothetical protein